jgi:hypothetical protein
MRTVIRTILFALLCWTVHAFPALAQTGGAITGQVADETGGVLPGVNVTLRSVGSDRFSETVTDGVGTYRFDDVSPGAAEVVFRLINFGTVRREVAVAAGGTLTADAVLFVAASADIVITAPERFGTSPKSKTRPRTSWVWRRLAARARSPLHSSPCVR